MADRELPDEVLVVAAIMGDLEAFTELVARYRAAVIRTAQSIVGREDAEDVAQDALLLAFKALPSIEDPTRFAAWLSAITRHRAFRFLRRESVLGNNRVEMDLLGLAVEPTQPARDDDEEIQVAFEMIAADYAIVLRLRFSDEMPLKRIASYLDLPLSTVKWRLHRGKKMLREQIELIRTKGVLWKEKKNC